MAFHHGIDGEPLRAGNAGHTVETEQRHTRQGSRLANGTLACPGCDAPVALPRSGLSPADLLACPYCSYGAPAREFLSLSEPSRPARVVVRLHRRVHRTTR